MGGRWSNNLLNFFCLFSKYKQSSFVFSISKNIEPILIALLLNILNLPSLESLYIPCGKHVKKTLLEKHCITFMCPGAIKTGSKDIGIIYNMELLNFYY
ncbi:hypothetical protein V1477_004906 [Vespula maculifrons]|uniref:Uncharacterized protein n=1 Tax=Vespula maculifrons TaxID=7453 RepID=A0ABD2CNE8_VESMC